MTAKEIAKELANRVNQEHYIEHLLGKLYKQAYSAGFESCREKVGEAIIVEICAVDTREDCARSQIAILSKTGATIKDIKE